MSFKVKILGKTFFEIESDKVTDLKEKAVAEKKNEEFGQLEYVITDSQRDMLETCKQNLEHHINVFSVCKKKDIDLSKAIVDIGAVKSFIREMVKSYDHFKEKREELVKK